MLSKNLSITNQYFLDPTSAAINLEREDIFDNKFSLNNYSVLHLFKQWMHHVNLYDPKDFQSRR